ncbi:hypothetical protein BST61_g8103 [Cercospora zeina]
MSSNTNTNLAPPQQIIKDDSSEWESPEENEKDKAPSNRSAAPLYVKGAKVRLLADRGTERKWKVFQVHSDNTYDLVHDDTNAVKRRVSEGRIE